MSDEILTVLEVATLLKVADKTVYTMAQKGEIPAFKVRGQWRFRRIDIDAWIEQQTTSRSACSGRMACRSSSRCLLKANEELTAWLRGERSMPFGPNNEHVTVRLVDYENREQQVRRHEPVHVPRGARQAPRRSHAARERQPASAR
jgi:excisionase family DNA binding protein